MSDIGPSLKTEKRSYRIRHKTLHSILLIVRDRARPVPNPHNRPLPVCSTCGTTHPWKTYHLMLDAQGTILVSQGVYDSLNALHDKAGFELNNVIHDPPTLTMQPDTATSTAKAFDPGSIERRERIDADS